MNLAVFLAIEAATALAIGGLVGYVLVRLLLKHAEKRLAAERVRVFGLAVGEINESSVQVDE